MVCFPGEFYRYITYELVTPFRTIFNHIFDKGEYPSQWAEGIINALDIRKAISSTSIIIGKSLSQ